MAKFDKIEDIVVWQLAMELTNSIYNITNNNLFNKDFALRDQIRKSVISVPSNIAEGFERNSTNQFLYFLVIAKGSAGELRTQLLIAKNQNYLSQLEFEKINNEAIEVSKKLGSFITYLKEFKLKNSSNLKSQKN
ncbi:MAG: four helix bundle protein [Bacteroidota bacterium]